MAHLLLGTGGHLVVNAAGHLANVCESVGPPYGNCTYCDTTPVQYEATLSGITICNDVCWRDDSTIYSRKIIDVPSPNGVYTLDQVSACQWQYKQSGSYGSCLSYNNSVCSGSPTSTTSFILFVIYVYISSTAGQTRIYLVAQYQTNEDTSSHLWTRVFWNYELTTLGGRVNDFCVLGAG